MYSLFKFKIKTINKTHIGLFIFPPACADWLYTPILWFNTWQVHYQLPPLVVFGSCWLATMDPTTFICFFTSRQRLTDPTTPTAPLHPTPAVPFSSRPAAFWPISSRVSWLLCSSVLHQPSPAVLRNSTAYQRPFKRYILQMYWPWPHKGFAVEEIE